MDVQRQIRFEPHLPAVSRMVEPDGHGMQGLTWKTNKGVPGLFLDKTLLGIPHRVSRKSTTSRPTTSTATIDRISDQRMSDMSHMHSDLVCAAGCQHAFHQGSDSSECLQHTVAGKCRFSTRHHGHLLPVR